MKEALATCSRIVSVICCLAMQALGGTVSYHVTQNPAACREVHLGTLTKPPEITYIEEVSTGECHAEIRAANETELYLTAACQPTRGFTITFPRSREKYVVDLSHPNNARRIDEKAWESATPLPWYAADIGGPRTPSERGIAYRGHLLEKSGAKWAGVGEGPVASFVSHNLATAGMESILPTAFWTRLHSVNETRSKANSGLTFTISPLSSCDAGRRDTRIWGVKPAPLTDLRRGCSGAQSSEYRSTGKKIVLISSVRQYGGGAAPFSAFAAKLVAVGPKPACL